VFASNTASNEDQHASNIGSDLRVAGAKEEAPTPVLDARIPLGQDDRNGVLDEGAGNKAVQVAPVKQRWSREKYNAYQREYMRKKRGRPTPN